MVVVKLRGNVCTSVTDYVLHLLYDRTYYGSNLVVPFYDTVSIVIC